MSDQELFQKALELVRERTKKATFDTWFTRLAFVSTSDDIVTIGTPNQFVKEWIEDSELIQTLAAALRDSFGRPLTPSLMMTERAELSESGFIKRQELLPPEPAPAEERKIEALNGYDEASSVPLKRDNLFDNFIVGPANRLSHAAALAVAQCPGQAYNPLFLHSSSGLGKTHLLQAICHSILSGPERRRVLYLSCEDFINKFIEAVKEGALENFRYRYRHVDLLLIDDIHFLADKPRIQEEFFHTFNTLYNAQKQIVLSADCHPSEIPTLNERLVSRFKWGLVSRIDPPEFETRAAIIRKKSALKGAELPGEIASLLANHITLNVREIEGALNRLIGTARLMGRTIDRAFTLEVLSDLIETSPHSIPMTAIIDATTAHFDVKAVDLRSKKRTKKIAFTRQICMYLARDLTELTLQEIGSAFGGRDHTTVIYAIDKIQEEVRRDENLRETLDVLARSARSAAMSASRS